MNNFINFFYGINVDNITYDNGCYIFTYKGYIYKLYIYDDDNNLNFMLDINKKLIGNTLISEIITNKNNEIISFYNNVSYILIKIYANTNKLISLEEISHLANSMYKQDVNVNYGMLWSKKIDYLENLINENGKKYPLIVDSFNYFVGMAENAISYYNNILINNNDYRFVISHKRIKFDDTVEALYNPLNIIFDYKVRDIAEYIKNSFFNNNINIFNEFVFYIKNNPLSLTEVKILISRLLYPSFYFDLYEDILINDKEEKIIFSLISKLDDYQLYLDNFISFLKRFYDIEEILWLKKRF